MRRIIYIFSLIIISIAAKAAPIYTPWWRWAVVDTSYTHQYSETHHVLAVKNGKAFWGHMLRSTLVNNGTVYGDYNLAEYDTSGTLTNGAYLGGKVNLMQALPDGSGNWYILGNFYDTLVLPNGMMVTRSIAAKSPNHFMMRINSGVSFGWIKLLGGSDDVTSQTFAITNNNIYIPLDSVDRTRVGTMNIVSGNYTTLFTQGGTSTTSSIAVDIYGNIYMAGSCAPSSVDFNGVVQAPVINNHQPAYLVKYNANGTHSWHHWLVDNMCVNRKVTLAPGNILYYTGALHNGFTFGGQTLHGPAYTFDFIAARLDTAGNVAWVRQIDSNSGGGDASLNGIYNAVVTPDTALAIFAQIRGYIYWPDTVETNIGPGIYAATAVSFAKDGHTKWARPVIGITTTNQQIATDGSDAVWVTGNGFSTVNYLGFDTMRIPIPYSVFTPYLAKLTLTPRPVVPNGISLLSNELSVQVSPIPASDVLHFTFGKLNGTATISLRDISGREVKTLTVPSGNKNIALDINSLPRGMYVAKITSGSVVKAIPVLLE